MVDDTILGRLVGALDCSPWGASAGRHVCTAPVGHWTMPQASKTPRPLYTAEEKQRRDASPWTMVQGILAPLQFLVFAVSLSLVLRFLLTGQGEQAATMSILIKTALLYTIMVTGAIWEHEIYGKYLFAPAFFWEDMVSMVVIALHSIYLAGLLTGSIDSHTLMLIALAAYATYVCNAAQFILKLRAARLAGDAHAMPQGMEPA